MNRADILDYIDKSFRSLGTHPSAIKLMKLLVAVASDEELPTLKSILDKYLGATRAN